MAGFIMWLSPQSKFIILNLIFLFFYYRHHDSMYMGMNRMIYVDQEHVKSITMSTIRIVLQYPFFSSVRCK